LTAQPPDADKTEYQGVCDVALGLAPSLRAGTAQQGNRYWHFLARQGERNQYLAVWAAYQARRSVGALPHRVLALLGQRRVVHVSSAASLAPTKASSALRITCSKGTVDKGDVDTKWWRCCVCPGHTRSTMGSILLRAPGPRSPCRYSGAQQPRLERLNSQKRLSHS
jgi:hypothetical protein